MSQLSILNVGAGDTSRKRALRRYRKSEKGKKNQKRYLATEKGKAMARRREQKYNAANREKRLAKRAMAYAVERGWVPPPHMLPCFRCIDRDADVFHHPSYAKEDRRKVVPLCQPCHIAVHYGDLARGRGVC